MKAHLLFQVVILTALVLGACTGGRRQYPTDNPGRESELSKKVSVDAYLFDCRIRVNGVLRTVKIELYRIDSIVAIYGSSYLGRGAFRGRIADDSMLIFFPTTDEYLFEPNDRMLIANECGRLLSAMNLPALLTIPGKAIFADSWFQVTTKQNSKRISSTVTSSECQWQFQVDHDLVSKSWQLKQLRLEEDGRLKFSAKRRSLRRGARIDRSRFDVAPTSSASRITP